MGNVPEGAKDKELQELFEAFGEVEEVAMLRGYGFVVRSGLYLEYVRIGFRQVRGICRSR